jgi:hypothetical protein
MVAAQASPRGIPTNATPDPQGSTQRPEPPHLEIAIMAEQSTITRVKYCQHHNRVWSSRSRTWKAVPTNFITELRHADLPVDLIEWPCPRCTKPRDQ